jgi:hypothetical protein
MGGKPDSQLRMAVGRLEWRISPTRIMRLATSLPKKSAGAIEQFSISLYNIYGVCLPRYYHIS